jgi:aminobenzoyl-glutamate utilization protein B
MADKNRITSVIDESRELFFDTSDKIWSFAESTYEEYKSAGLLCEILEKAGFTVTRGVGDLRTAFIAEYGNGKPIIGLLGEYDALVGLSQEAGATEERPIIKGGNGHGCGHHGLGTGSVAAAISVKEYLKQNGIPGTIRYYGCPAEEIGAGKAFMARDGAFQDLDAALTWHPASTNIIAEYSTLAYKIAYFQFHGISAHSAIAPHMGRSALDAVELMNVGVNFLREHVIPEARIHYAITNSGGSQANAVQKYAEVQYMIRAPKTSQVKEIYDRIIENARGAALMTDTKMNVVLKAGLSNMIPNSTLNRVLFEKMTGLGPIPWDENDAETAKKFQAEIKSEKSENFEEKVLCDFIPDKIPFLGVVPASTDVGDVSWLVPTASISVACYTLGTVEHSWQLVAQGKTSIFHKGMLYAGKVLALAAAQLFDNPELVENAKKEHKERLGGEKYFCPIPKEMKPILG